MKEFKGKIVLITGASRGIGRQLAVDFAKEGSRCVLVSRNSESLEQTRRLMVDSDSHVCLACDVGRYSQVQAMAAHVRAHVGSVDILINNAGISRYYHFLETPLEDMQELMQTNYWGMVYCTREFLPQMIEKRSGHIVNISSIAGRIGTARHTVYSASKFAVSGFSESLYYELDGTGVHVTVVNPGVIDTHLFDHDSFRDFPKAARAMMKPPVVVSRAIMRAVQKNIFEITVPRSLWTGVVVKAVAPSLFRRLHLSYIKRAHAEHR